MSEASRLSANPLILPDASRAKIFRYRGFPGTKRTSGASSRISSRGRPVWRPSSRSPFRADLVVDARRERVRRHRDAAVHRPGIAAPMNSPARFPYHDG